jgi:hypothetical protein
MKSDSLEQISSSSEEETPSLWQGTSLYLAPSANGAGWGVFAARSFRKGDIVEIAPLFLRFEEERPKALKETLLNNYHYEHWSWEGHVYKLQTMISFGYTLYYNHSANDNVEQRTWGKEPDISDPDHVAAVGFFASSDIKVGEELLSDYGDLWFPARGLTVIESLSQSQSKDDQPAHLLECQENYRSKVYSGYGRAKFQKVIDSHEDTLDMTVPYRMETILPYLPPACAGYGNVIARERVEEGVTLEFAPVMVLSKHAIRGTLLETLGISWKDLEPSGFEFVTIQRQHDGPGCVTIKEQIPIGDSVLFPLGGSIALVSRSLIHHNARVEVEPDDYNESSFCLRIVATKLIEVGEVVVLHLPQPATAPMVVELALTGQPLAASLLMDNDANVP